MSSNVSKSDLDLNSDAISLDERNENETLNPPFQTLTKPSEGSSYDSSPKRVIQIDGLDQMRVCSETQDRKSCKDQIEALFGDSSLVDGDSSKEDGDQKDPILIVDDDGGDQKKKTQIVDSRNGESCDEKALVSGLSVVNETQVLEQGVGSVGDEIGKERQVKQVETVGGVQIDVLEETQILEVGEESICDDGNQVKQVEAVDGVQILEETQVLEAVDETVGEESICDNGSQVKLVETGDGVQIDVLEETQVLEIGVVTVGEESICDDGNQVKQVETVGDVQIGVFEETQILEVGDETVREGIICDDGSQVKQVETIDDVQIGVLEETPILEVGDETVGEESICDDGSLVKQVETVDEVSEERVAKEIQVLKVGVGSVAEETTIDDRCEIKHVEKVDAVQVDVLKEIVVKEIHILEAGDGNLDSGTQGTGLSATLPAETRESGAVITKTESCLLEKKHNTEAQVAERCSSLQNGGQISDSQMPDENPDMGANMVVCNSVLNGSLSSSANVTISETSQSDGNQDIGAQVFGEDWRSSVQITESVNIVPDLNLNKDQKLTIPVSESDTSILEECKTVVTETCDSTDLPKSKDVEAEAAEILETPFMEVGVLSSQEVQIAQTQDKISLPESEARSRVPDMEISPPIENQKGGNIVIDLVASHVDENRNTGGEVTELGCKGEISQPVEALIDAEKNEDRRDFVEQAMELDRKNHPSHYQDQENQFSFGDLVWGKVKSHPWWPGQIFDPSDSSKKAIKYQKKDNFLVAYFGDRTFAWCEKTQLKPFRANFALMESQGNTDAFLNAVDSALDEVSRRVELGLVCLCLPKSSFQSLKCQEVVNAGIQEGVTVADITDKSFSVNSFEPNCLLQYIKELALFTTDGVNRLEFTVARAQLTAYFNAKGYSKLPQFHVYGGLVENDADYEFPNRTGSKNSAISSMDEGQNSMGLVLENGGKQISKSPSLKRNRILGDGSFHSRKQKSLSELMVEKKVRRALSSGRAEAGKRVTSKSVSPSVGINNSKKTKGSFSADLVLPSVGTRKIKKTKESFSADSVRSRRKKRKRIAALGYLDFETSATPRSLKKDSFLRKRKKKRMDSESDPDFETPTSRKSFKHEPKPFDFESLRNRKMKRLASLRDSDIKTPMTRGSFKVGECISRIANQLTGSLPMPKLSRESFRKNSVKLEGRRTNTSSPRTPETRRSTRILKHSSSPGVITNSVEVERSRTDTSSPRALETRRGTRVLKESSSPDMMKNSVKVERSRADTSSSPQTPETGRRIRIPKESSSPDEMLSQLCLTARDPMKGYTFLSVIIGFFTGFRNSISQDVSGPRKHKSKERVGGKSGRRKLPSSKSHSAGEVKDSYWTDRIIFSSPEEPLQMTRKRKREFEMQIPTMKENRQNPSERPLSSPRYSSNLDSGAEKHAVSYRVRYLSSPYNAFSTKQGRKMGH